MVECPQPLGAGVKTMRNFCDVPIERDPNRGIIITLPPHTGPVTLTFDLHNRHLYSEELVKTGRAYRRYTASLGVMAMDNTLLSRAAIQNEFRTAADRDLRGRRTRARPALPALEAVGGRPRDHRDGLGHREPP